MINFAWKTWIKQASQSLWRREGQRSKPLPRRVRSCRPWLERLEDRTLLSVTLQNSYPGLGFASSGGLSVPPDTQAAAGTKSVVETVNQAIVIYPQKTNNGGAV